MSTNFKKIGVFPLIRLSAVAIIAVDSCNQQLQQSKKNLPLVQQTDQNIRGAHRRIPKMPEQTQKGGGGAPPAKKQGSTSLDTSHLGHGRYAQDDKPTAKTQPAAVPPPPAPPVEEEEEDWGKNEPAQEEEVDEAPEQELTPSEPPAPVAQEPQPEKPVEQTATEPEAPKQQLTPQNFMEMIKQLHEAENQALATVDQEIAEAEKNLESLRQQRTAITAWRTGGATPQPEEESPRRRRGGRRRRATSDEGTSPETPAATSGRRTRPKNDKTLKEAIVEVLTKKGRTNLKTIAEDIEAGGYKTNSKKFTNTVRVQLYRLEDDKEIKIHEDGTFSLVRK